MVTKKIAHRPSAVPAKNEPDDFAALVAEVRSLIQAARRAAATAVDTLQVHTNFQIGRRIVEHEQKGEKRAGYGQELLKNLSFRLAEEVGKGFSARNLRSFRAFFLTYQERGSEIWQSATAKSFPETIAHQPARELTSLEIWQKPSAKSPNPFTISWSHYVLLLTLKDPDERSFYEIEASREGWSLPELKRQVASSLYERLALSRKKDEVRKLAAEGLITRPPGSARLRSVAIPYRRFRKALRERDCPSSDVPDFVEKVGASQCGTYKRVLSAKGAFHPSLGQRPGNG